MSTVPRRATISDIARRAGVSIGAVSFALNGRPGVSDQTRERIISIARELNWRPHSAARALGGTRVGAVGFVVNRPARTIGSDTFFGDLISGMQLALSAERIGLTLLVARDLEEEVATYQDWWSGRRVDGVVVIDPRGDDPRIEVIRSLALPAVVIGSHPSREGDPPAVWIDDSAATLMLLRYLHALGHRRIVHVTGPAELEHTVLRTRALQAFATEHHLEAAETLTTDYSAENGASMTRMLLSRTHRPSAIVYDNDVLAVAGLGVAQEMGVAVPRELSIASFDDSILARLVRPSLTTLTRDTVELGERAARLLLAQVVSPEPLGSLEGPALTLSVRDSTAPPRS